MSRESIDTVLYNTVLYYKALQDRLLYQMSAICRSFTQR